ncbi:MAG: hypothetical protein J4431_04380 [Candidatus Aenigmarchaeota archaeon]|nr:hypothetical protein [Candidatus Aenigmarchaeota archaeon]
MKGSALPVETIVIVILSIIVLVAVLLFFFGSFTPATEELKARQTIASVCGEYAAKTQCKEEQNSEFFTVPAGDGAAEATAAQIEKGRALVSACRTASVSECAGSTELDAACARICCAAFCPPSAEE